MGIVTFTDFADGSDPQEAFDRARATAIFESGHGSGSGSIAQHRTFFMVDQTRLPEGAAQIRMNLLLDPATSPVQVTPGAIAVADDDCFKMSKRAIEVDASALTGYEAAHPYQEHLMALMQDQGLLPTDGIVNAVTVVKNDTRRVIEVAATTGKTETVYLIVGPRSLDPLRETSQQGYVSQAAARKALTELLKRGRQPLGGDVQEASIVGLVRRVGGQHLVTGAVSEQGRKIKVQVTVAVPKTKTPPIKGYYFFGYSHM